MTIVASLLALGATTAAAAPPLASPPVAMARTPDGAGYWIVTRDGSIANYGSAGFYDSLPGRGVRVSNIVGIAPTPTGRGYWLAGADGGIFALGDAGYYNSLPGLGVRVSNIVGIAPTPTGRGYWLAGADGGIFALGDAGFYKSLGGVRLNAPVIGFAPTPNGQGYWLAARDGGIFALGNAGFYGRPEVVGAPVATGRTTPASLTLSSAGADFIASHEGFRGTPYNDANGHCTVGFGHLLHRGNCTANDRSSVGTMSRSTGVSLLQTDSGTFQSSVRSNLSNTPLYQHEFDALVDFSFNVGTGAFSTSSVRNDLKLSPPNYSATPANFNKWNGDKLCGIYRRRLDEGNLFSRAAYSLSTTACPAGYR